MSDRLTTEYADLVNIYNKEQNFIRQNDSILPVIHIAWLYNKNVEIIDAPASEYKLPEVINTHFDELFSSYQTSEVYDNLKIDYNSLLTLKLVGVKSEMQLNQREIKNMNAAQQEQSAFSEQSNLVRRLVLFVNGMSNDFFLLSTDAPQKYIEEYCKWYNKWMEDGGQGDPLEPLRKKYYVNLLIDSETSDREELEAIIDGKTVESYDLFRYWDDK